MIPEPVTGLLHQLGEWLAINGEAIYGTRPWQIYGEGPTSVPTTQFREQDYQPFTAQDVRFTTKEHVLYATVLGWPGRECTIRSLGATSSVPAGRIAEISMLGTGGPLEWLQDEAGLTIDLPATRPCDHATVFRIVLKQA
jgi:alpha-L-fucosidase